ALSDPGLDDLGAFLLQLVDGFEVLLERRVEAVGHALESTAHPYDGPMAKVMLLDGNSLAYRAFFALPTDMATASGQVTNAVFGFTSMLVNLLKDHKPDSIAVAFDRPEPTFRHELVTDYKAGRAETPDILRQQMGLVRQVAETLKIPMVDASGYEAD